jgi:small subunit ribosomal protein S20
MANHKSAEKRARQTERRTVVNAARRSRVRGSIKKVEEAIKSGDKKAALDALKAAQPEIQRGASARVVTKNAARASRVATQCTRQGNGLKPPSASARMNAAPIERRFSFVRCTENYFRNFFLRRRPHQGLVSGCLPVV